MEYEITNGKCIIYSGTTIEEEFFQNNTEFSEVVFPETLKTIGERAFKGCRKLKAVRIPSLVKSIGAGAFSGCSSLESIIVDDCNPRYRSLLDCCMTRDGRTLVFGCKSSRIPACVKTIGENAFDEMGLTGMVIPEGVRSIGQYAFAGNIFLTSIALPSTLEEIGTHAFLYCDELLEIDIPGAIKFIGEEAFDMCKKLKAVRLHEGMRFINELAFSGCGVESIKIPSTVTKIESFAFSGCTHLTSIEIPDSITDYGERIWGSCNNLRDIILPSGGPDKYSHFREYLEKENPSADVFAVLGMDYYGHYTLHVPKGTETAYKKDPFFDQFGTIVTI